MWKPAEYAPATAEALAQLFLHAGLPDGVLNLVLADGPQTFAGLEQALDRGLVDKVGFTGSSAVGAEIGALCGRHLQSPCLELGGKNPLVVMADADLDLAVEGALFSGFGTAGQRCTSLGTVIVDERVHDDFFARLKAAVEGAAIGDPAQDVLYGPMIHERFLERFESEWLGLIRDHHSVHGSTATGRITAANPREGFVGDDPEKGLFVHPTLVDGVRVDDDLANTETFGPLVGVASFGDWEEAMALANGHGYGLSASIYTTNPQNAFRYPRAHRRRHGQRQQLDQRRRGPPALRRQRQVGQRLAPVGHVGASTSSRAGSRSTGTTPASCRRRRWTSPTSSGDLDYRLEE